MDLDVLREATERVSTDLFDFLADIDIGEQTLGDLAWLTQAARAVLDSEELEDGFCTTHGAQGFGPDDDNEAQCWVHWVWGDGRVCSIEPAVVVRVRLLAEEGT